MPRKMPGANRPSHEASGWGSSKMATLSGWHRVRAPHLSHFLDPPPSPETQRADNRPPHPCVEGSLQKMNKYVHPGVPTGILTQPLWHPPCAAPFVRHMGVLVFAGPGGSKPATLGPAAWELPAGPNPLQFAQKRDAVGGSMSL